MNREGGWWGGPRHRVTTTLEPVSGFIDYAEKSTAPFLLQSFRDANGALEAGDAATAEAIYRDVVAKYPNDPRGHEALAGRLALRKKIDEAIAEYQIALRLDPSRHFAHYGLGCIAYDENRFAEAREHLEKAVARKDTDVESHLALVMVFDRLGDKVKARLHYEKVKELGKTNHLGDHVKHKMEELKR